MKFARLFSNYRGMDATPAVQEIGKRGEQLAFDYLVDAGYEILERNFRFRNGEVDLIVARDNFIIFVEVKTADFSSGNFHPFGPPETWVTRRKQIYLFNSAEYFLWKRSLLGANCRFDLITVRLFRGGPRIDHYPNAYWR